MRAALVAVLAFLAGCATQPRLGDSVDAPIPVTIQAIKADPKHYRDKFVLVRGLVDPCRRRGGSCSLIQTQPGQMPASDAAALLISFTPAPEPAAPKNDTGSAIAGGLMNALYRLSEVTLVGRYDAGCTLSREARPGEADEIVVCVDGYGSDLKVAYVRTVHKRWPATAFPADPYLEDKLSAAPSSTADRMFSDYKAALLAVGSIGEADEASANHRAFLYTDFPDAGAICICRADSCEGAWPSLRAHLFPAPANPYYCVDAVRADGTWHFSPESR